MDKIKRIKELTASLNEYRDAYYNNSKLKISDYEYDSLFDELQTLENETGFILNNSPTHSVGYEIKSKLQKVKHSHPMLSLDKTKSIDDVISFLNGYTGIAMLKMDGLTTGVSYSDRKLVSAETRGNGVIGEDILHNARVIKNLPQQVSISDLLVDGEVIIKRSDFEKINSAIINEDDKYKNLRNLASGSIRQLDSKVAASRNLNFIAWRSVNGVNDNSFITRLHKLQELGFDVVPYEKVPIKATKEDIKEIIDKLKSKAEYHGFPIDGIVFGYDDVTYGESLGATGHHLRSQIAYKFYDEEVVTILRNIEWSCGKTGNLTPVAIFDPVDLDGTEVSRASLHNVSICKELRLGIGDEISVYKANQIIPQIRENLTMSNSLVIPDTCPICSGKTDIVKDNDTEVLMCINLNCNGKLLGKLTHFVSKNAMNIDGLSEATLKKFLSLGFVKSFIDIYELKNAFGNDITKLDGFSKKSANKLFNSIEDSRNTTLYRFIYSLSIPLIGKTASKTISNYFDGNFNEFVNACENMFNWTILNDFGISMSLSIKQYYSKNYNMINKLATYMNFQKKENINSSVNLLGKTFVITGSLKHYTNRDALKESIESLGGKVSGSVSSKTNYLINNNVTSNSSKNKKAKELGIPIITEEEFVSLTC